jgi:CBS domain-containing protein
MAIQGKSIRRSTRPEWDNPSAMADPGPQFDLRALFTTTTVGELTLTQVPVLCPGDTAEQAAAAMRAVSHGCALVCEAGHLVGIITERDLLKLLVRPAQYRTPLASVMSVAPKTVAVTDRLMDAVRLMDQGGYRRLPVVGDQGVPVGIVDVKTVIAYLVDEMPATVYNQASGSLLSVREREGA